MAGVSGSSTDSPTALSRSAVSATRLRSPGNQAACIAYISIRVASGGGRPGGWAAAPPQTGGAPPPRPVGARARDRGPGLDDVVGGLGCRSLGKAPRVVEVADLRACLGGRGEPSGLGPRISAELHRPLVRGRCGRVPAPGSGLP